MTEEIVGRESPITDSLRKAAILISALNRDSADALLEKMGTEQAARVRNAVFELEIVSDEEQDQIVREFVSAGGGTFDMVSKFHSNASEDEYFGASTSQHREDEETSAQESNSHPNDQLRKLKWQDDLSTKPSVVDEGLDGYEAPSKNCPFPILREASAETLANHLMHENAQVIAVVVADLPPQRAAELIALLTPSQQVDVLGRVAGLEAAVPAAIEVLQRQLEDKLTEEILAQRSREVGLAKVKSILDAAGSKRHELLDNLKEIDGELSQQVATAKVVPLPSKGRSERRLEEVREKPTGKDAHATRPATSHSIAPRPTTELPDDAPATVSGGAHQEIQPKSKGVSNIDPTAFEQLAELDDECLALLFREVDPEIILVALAGASSEFVKRVMQPLPSREARSLRRRMERLGPIRLDDIAIAQREVAHVAAQLVEDGRLPKLVKQRFTVAA